MELWMIWIGLGLICLIIEIFTPGFLFLSFGISAIIAGLFSLIITPVYWQIIIFIVSVFILFINLSKLSKRLYSKVDKPTNVAALIGKSGYVTEKIGENSRGYVKIGGEEWPAVEQAQQELAEKTKIVVKEVDGNKLIVEKLEQ